MRAISLLALLFLAACASADIAPKVTTGPIQGSVNFEIGHTSFPPPTPPAVIKQPCIPPGVLLAKAGHLPRITAHLMTLRDFANLSLTHITAYNKLAAKHAALADWVKQNCQ